MENNIVIIGYSGHGYVAVDILAVSSFPVSYYCETEEKVVNPFSLQYLGTENAFITSDKFNRDSFSFFIAIGSNTIRSRVHTFLQNHKATIINAIHPSAIISDTVIIGKGCMISSGAIINPLSIIRDGAICNTASIIEHECYIGDFAHIGPGTVLCGNVTIGANSFIGANSVVRQGIIIGDNVTIGMGSIVTKNIPSGETWMGNPAKKYVSHK